MKRAVGLLAVAVGGLAGGGSEAWGQDVSAPVILQYFESSWRTMERRAPDVFMAGYGAIWTPPPGRALYTDAGGGIGYDVYDRFDLGRPRDPTLYGTETGYRQLIRTTRQWGGSVYVDFVHHHEGSFDIAPGNSPGPYVQSRNDYPGFVLSNVGAEDGDTYRDPPAATSGNPAFEYQYRLARLITLNFTASNGNSFVRNPVPGVANNVPQAPSAWAIPTATTDANGRAVASTLTRRANTPDAGNRRFYPDLDGPFRTVVDGGVSYRVYDFNSANPSAGDPTSEGVGGYMMRYAQWLVQSVGVDGLRIDAARHVPLGASGDSYNPTQVNVPRLIDRAVAGASTRYNLDGTQRSVFQFQEVFNGDPNFLQGFVRRSAQAGDTTNPNRDVLDFPLWFAMRSNLTGNESNNNWYNVRNASQDNRDDGLANNGSQSIGFVVNHDEGGVDLSNVAHALVLTRPGNAYVYFDPREFDRSGNNSFFLKSGRGDALGGQYGTILTRLVDIRNGYGRGNFAERWIETRLYAYERTGSMIVGLSNATSGQNVTSFDERTMYTVFAPGTRLVELTGNADDVQVDPLGQIPNYVTVFNTDNSGLGAGRVTLRIPRNQNIQGLTHGRGYVIYGLPRPSGSLTLSNVSQTLAADPITATNNATARLTAIDVISADSFSATLNTSVVSFSDGYVDHRAAGNVAMLRLDDGADVNGNGVLDNPSSAASNATRYGFEAFTSNTPGFVSSTSPISSRAGQYSVSVDARNLSEGYHYLTARVWRAAGAGESEIYTDVRKVIYVDRLKPVSGVDGFARQTGATSGALRDLQVRSLDLTADRVYVLMDLAPNLTESQVLALATAQSQAQQIDRDLFSVLQSGVTSGNHVATVVTYEVTGTYNVQRITGLSVTDGVGLGLGDVDNDGTISPTDISMFDSLFRAFGGAFSAAADIVPDGVIDISDVRGLGNVLLARGASQATLSAYYSTLGSGFVVPEPAALGLLLPGLAMLRRTRR